MFTASRALHHSAQLGRPLPHIAELSALYSAGVEPRVGEVIMVAGIPGAMKSSFVLWWTAMMRIPTLYISADMNSFQASARLAALRFGHTTDHIERSISAGLEDEYLEGLKDEKIVFAFDSNPSLTDLENQLQAYVEAFDEWPAAFVVDNLMDVQAEYEDDDERSGLNGVITWCRKLSHQFGVTVFLLHHMSESGTGDMTLPRPRKDVQQKVNQKPELILSVAVGGDGGNEFRIACVKQRMGPQDVTGKNYVTLAVRPEVCQFDFHVPSYGWSYSDEDD